MAKGNLQSGPFSWAVAKKICSVDDIERLACAFLATENVYNFDANKAASEYGKAKAESFKRQIWVITKKIKEAQGGHEVGAPIVNGKGGAGQKRKATDDGEDEPTTKKQPSGRGKEAKAEKGNDADEHVLGSKNETAAEASDSDGELI